MKGEDIIYVVLIVGSILVSILKKFFGKKEQQAQPAQTPKPTRSLEDVFRELTGEVITQPEPQPVVYQSFMEHPQTVVKPQPVMNDALALKKHIFKSSVSVQSDVPQRSFAVDLDDSNDWQRAFVYSEIFNRKY